MSQLFRTLLVAALAAAPLRAAAPPPIDGAASLPPGEVAAVQQTVFVRMFSESLREGEKASLILFLGLGCGDGPATVPSSNPTTEFLSELHESGWNVRPASAAVHPRAGRPYRDRESNREGLMFCVGTIEVVGESELQVSGEFYRDGKSAEGVLYGVERIGNCWQVVSRRSKRKA